RMIFSGMEHMNKEPFKHVLIHGLVRDSQGRKMSKSLGNGVDPLEVIEEFGADALRFTLATGNAPGNDMRYSIERVTASRNFANKIWNASRFVQMNLTIDKLCVPDEKDLALEDKWILHKFNQLVTEVTENLDKFELGVAVAKLYDFIWDEFCDWYIELVKPRLYEAENTSNTTAQQVLSYVLSNTLKLLHPFMPFITEEIWQSLPHEGESIVISDWPKANAALEFSADAARMELLMDALKAVRNKRTEMNIPPSKKAAMFIVTEKKELFENGAVFFQKLAGASTVTVQGDKAGIADNAVAVIVDGAQIFIPMGELVDFEKEIQRLEDEKKRLLGEIKRVEGKLSNKGFVDKAPKHVVEEEQAKGEKYRQMLLKVEESMTAFQKEEK
ncbi:MAG: class I tRNA ligase family protein, partial [Clostridia bacterium]|nr:class I tRNA ligase family protein [Clostridia bacterium]